MSRVHEAFREEFDDDQTFRLRELDYTFEEWCKNMDEVFKSRPRIPGDNELIELTLKTNVDVSKIK